MEEFPVQALSEGLGFYEPHLEFKEKKTKRLEKQELIAGIPEEFLPKKGEIPTKAMYDKLQSLLENRRVAPVSGGNTIDADPISDRDSIPSHRRVAPVSGGDTIDADPISDRDSIPSHRRVAPVSGGDIIDADPISARDSIPSHRRVGGDTVDARRFNKDTVQTSPLNSSSFFLLPLRKILYSWGKIGLTDVLTTTFFFFPPFILFLLLTEPQSITMLSFLWPKILLAFLCFFQMYCLLCRLFCFETCGEALAQVRLLPLKSNQPAHPVAFFGRFLLSCATGFVVIPLLSLITKKDVAGYLTGLHSQKI